MRRNLALFPCKEDCRPRPGQNRLVSGSGSKLVPVTAAVAVCVSITGWPQHYHYKSHCRFRFHPLSNMSAASASIVGAFLPYRGACVCSATMIYLIMAVVRRTSVGSMANRLANGGEQLCETQSFTSKNECHHRIICAHHT